MIVYASNSNKLRTTLTNEDGAITDATVTYEITDVDGTVITSGSMSHAASGTYTETLLPDVAFEPGEVYTLTIDGSLVGETEPSYHEIHALYAYARRGPGRDELELMFGEENVSKWADLDNDQDAAKIAARVSFALFRGLEQAQDILRGGPVTLSGSEVFEPGLADCIVRLAGVWLYENRGVNDVSDDKDGRHRLKYHRDIARKYLMSVRAGQIRLRSATQARSVPGVE